MKKGITIRFSAGLLALLFTGNTAVLGHGGEDHGDQPAPTTNSSKGTVTHTTKLEDIELTLKHPVLVPDTAVAGKIFLTEFQTNVPVEGAIVVVEFEGADGRVIEAVVEKTDAAGVFNIKIPALPEGSYKVRAKITTKNETDTATFSGVEVTHTDSGVTASAFGWAKTLFIGTLFFIVAALFAILLYFALRTPLGRSLDDEAISV